MHPSQMSGFRKTIIAGITILFAGALLVFTAQANIDLLTTVYPDPRFVMFGILALEGGVIYWTGYYLLHPNGIHKAIAVLALAIDAVLSGIGFFYEMEQKTNSVGTIQLPPVIVIVAGAVAFNVFMSILSHLISSDAHVKQAPAPQPKEEPRHYAQGYEVQTFAQTTTETGPKGPGLLKNAAAGAIAGAQDIMELAREKRKQRRETVAMPQVQVQEEGPKAQASLVEEQAD